MKRKKPINETENHLQEQSSELIAVLSSISAVSQRIADLLSERQARRWAFQNRQSTSTRKKFKKI